MTTPHYEDAAVRLFHGDCLNVLADIPDNSVDAVVCDPPYSLSFMSAKWDTHATPLDFQRWCEQWAVECLRVLKPGGFIAAFGGTRTFHRLACAIEDAGFEIRDSIGYGHTERPSVLAWVHGQGFPKGKSQLKPAWEPIVVARKPLIGTIAQNVLAHGTGALNIDATRINPGTPARDGGGYAAHKVEQTKGWDRPYVNGVRKTEGHTAGRWPTNVIFDGDMANALNEQTESLHARGNTRPTYGGGGSGDTVTPGSRILHEEPVNYGDTGGASRFFPVFRSEQPVRSGMGAHSCMLTGCESAPTAATESRPSDPGPSTAPRPAPVTPSQLGAGKSDASTTSVVTADGSGRTTPATSARTAPEAAQTRSSGPSDQPASSVEIPCGSCGTGTAPSDAVTPPAPSENPEPGQPSTADSSGHSPTPSPAPYVETPEKPGTTLITTGSTTSPGCAGPATSMCTTKECPPGARRCAESVQVHLPDDFVPWKYQAKAPARERPSYVKDDGTKIAHPTVKPLELFRWLTKLVCPPGGTVLDPFAGSGTTVEAAILEGFQVIGIEREADYLPLIEARIARNQTAGDGLPAAGDALALFDVEEPA